MVTPRQFPVDDQTDEDFFDKLVDDDEEFGSASRQDAANMSRALSSLSIGDVGAALDDAAADATDQQEKEPLVEHCLPDALASDEKAAESLDPVEAVERVVNNAPKVGGSLESEIEMVSPDFSVGESSGTKGTSVKEVLWSSFYADPQQFGTSDGFGSYTDFGTDNVDASDYLKSSFMENRVGDLGTNLIQPQQQQDAQFYSSANEQTTSETNDPHYWENLYPGWKYDMSTGQWYQVDGYDETKIAQSNGHNAEDVNAQESLQEKVQAVGDEFVPDQRSEVSYLQQTAKSVVGTVGSDSTAGVVSDWNQVSQGSMVYPSNMVFDPQYPGWYYDTNTQQWYTLESYTQAVQNTGQDQLTEDVNISHGYVSKENSSAFNDIGQFGHSTVQGDSSMYREVGQFEQNNIQGHGGQETVGNWNALAVGNYAPQNMWQPEAVDNNTASFSGNQNVGTFYGSTGHATSYSDQHTGFKTFEPGSTHTYANTNGVSGFQSFVPAENAAQFSQPKVVQTQQAHLSHSYYGNQNTVNYSPQPFQSANASYPQTSYAHNEGRSSAGRPSHALVTFGFGGKLIVMKEPSCFTAKLDYGSQDTAQRAISVLSLMEVMADKTDASSIINGGCQYFNALCQQSFPGPLVGGNPATKDVNKWIDEKISRCESPLTDPRSGERLKVLLSLLKISCQHYGKLRSPFGSDPSLEESDGPESAVTKLFASAKKNSAGLRECSSSSHYMQSIPSEAEIQTTAVEVQNLLVSGRRKEALQRAQQGQLWGPALVLAAQLGEKFYVDTVKQMAHHQFTSGSPLRTLCLLIAGQPADVFSVDSYRHNNSSGDFSAPQQPAKGLANGMLDEWEENLAIITTNRTKDDELVIVHLGDCLWKERGEVTAAQTCYLVAEANFEPYSDSARLCLIGADHWKFPRTYASPEAIQRTELYEYSKVLGNSQFILQPFQPYKLIYAYMLAEVGKVSDSMRYCQASLKSLKNSGRAPEVETWKLLLSSLEERLRTHQQGGYSTNLDAAKLVGKLFTSIDRSIHRMMGAPPSTLPPLPPSSVNSKESYSVAPKVVNSQSTMAMSSLMPSPSVEAISEWTGESTRKIMHNRSISEPDFGRSPKQDSSKDAGSPDSQSKASVSRFGRIGSQLFQKTMGWVSRSRPDRQAKLGEQNKFYYDEKLKRWVEEGAEPPSEEAALPPPPTMASFQNGMSDSNVNSAFKSMSPISNGGPETKSLNPSEHGSGIPPIPPTTNQFSSHGRMGVRSRYVDTFNKGGAAFTNSFQSPSAASVTPPVGAKFFIPMAPAVADEQKAVTTEESIHDIATAGEQSTPAMKEASFLSPPSSTLSPSSIQRFPSMDNVTSGNNVTGSASRSGNGPISSRTRAASWSGSYSDMFNPNGLAHDGVPSSFIASNPSPIPIRHSSSQLNGGNFGDDLHEVEL